ncbi:MAG TPA: 1-deoxy-D-xylulose-5-phosphate reductoisomerase [Lacunisphaera sp.]|nr:1-deoxy-D-xylulose-5-phosphate reductoisomerase [Lacunisphaera sp.]
MSEPTRKRIVLLGATGSIGENTLRVIRAHRERLELVGVAAHHSAAELGNICREFGVRQAALYDGAAANHAKAANQLPTGTHLHVGMEGLINLATLPEADFVLIAVVGTAGLRPALAAIAAQKTIALASKEILVMAGKFVMAAAREHGVRLLPVDSEHNAVFQCLHGHPPAAVRRLLLTASGGALRDWPVEKLAQAAVADVLKHPNWAMGRKITVDSATLANKGLELIEAQWLFGLHAGQCQAVLHAQSIVHCLVEFSDGSMLAQLCPPSMTFPIQHCLFYPERAPVGTEAALPLEKILSLDFAPADEARYPCLRLARESMKAAGTAPAIYNAANEIAVAAFLAGQVPFLAIPRIIEHTLSRLKTAEPDCLETVIATDLAARETATAFLPSAR